MKRAILAFLCCAIAATSSASAGTTGSVAGTVQDERGIPVANVAVHIASPAAVSDTITDAKGFFVFASLAPDTYTIVIRKVGFNTQAYVGVTAFADHSLTLSFRMPRELAPIARICDCHGFGLVRPGITSDLYTRTGRYFNGFPNQLMMQLQTVPGLFVTYGSPVIR